jgi:hypothetical protein
MTRGLRLAATLACTALVSAGSAAAADGGSGTYTATDTSYYFTLFNSGMAAWQYFYLVGPTGTRFLGGANAAESTARCVVGPPEEIECGPLSANLAPPLAHLTFVATLASPVSCGAPFAFYVSTTDKSSFSRVDDLTFAGSCTTTLRAEMPPAINGLPLVGRTLVATPPVWNTTPTRVTYRWQRCTKNRCSAIVGATTLRLRLAKRDRGHEVRIVATATLDGATATSRSGSLAVP